MIACRRWRARDRPGAGPRGHGRQSPMWVVVSVRKARYLKPVRTQSPCVLRALCAGPSFSGGNDQRRRTRVARATGALAAGAPRPRRRDLRLAAFAGVRPAAGSAAQEAQALPARPHFPYRGPAHPRHYCLRLSARVHSGWMPASRITLLQRSVSSCLSLAMSCGLPPPALTWRSRKRALVADSLRISFIVRFNFETIGAGVLGGALMAFQVSERKPGT